MTILNLFKEVLLSIYMLPIASIPIINLTGTYKIFCTYTKGTFFPPDFFDLAI